MYLVPLCWLEPRYATQVLGRSARYLRHGLLERVVALHTTTTHASSGAQAARHSIDSRVALWSTHGTRLLDDAARHDVRVRDLHGLDPGSRRGPWSLLDLALRQGLALWIRARTSGH